ncbi:MAG: transcription termination/antitermination factor NusG [Lentisphaeria bacterium]|nr:transcription termination/antitermination protein NusG [Lentisphaeria bacterium]NQZ68447.1 transcription termination/antitermination factor NusG [Lentisphaeria bacterium]
MSEDIKDEKKEELEVVEEREKLVEDRGEWFFVQTLSGHEMKAKKSIDKRMVLENVHDRLYQVVIPMETRTEIKQGEKKIVKKKYFPGYILIIADLYKEGRQMDERLWSFIKETPGVTGFINDQPFPLSNEEMLNIKDMMREDAETERPKIDFVVGEMVKVKEGAFENFEGKIEEIDHDHGKLKLSVSIFGRSTPVELGYWQVERE